MGNMKRNLLSRTFFAIVGILLFVLSIELLKSTTNSLFPLFKNYLSFVNNISNALGFGWLSSYIILSGSPVAALALSLSDAGLLDVLPTFAMVIGSRLGSAFILILIGLIENFKGQGSLTDTTSIAFLTFFVTHTITFPALFIGMGLLKMDFINLSFSSTFLTSILNIYDPITKLFTANLGMLASFFISIFTLYFSLSIFERAFKDLKITGAKSSWVNYLMENPYFSFIFGALITLVGQSVSMSLGIMVPLYLKGFIQRRNLIPYIMGSNITTFIDTFAVAIILNNPVAVNIVSIAVISTVIPTLSYLLIYKYYYKLIVRGINLLLENKKILLLCVLFILLLPLSLFLI